MTALPDLNIALGEMTPGFYQKGLPAMWTLPALHWILIGGLATGLSSYRSRACAVILIAFALWVFIDAIVAFLHVGLFIGVYMLVAAGICFLFSGTKLRRLANSGQGD